MVFCPYPTALSAGAHPANPEEFNQWGFFDKLARRDSDDGGPVSAGKYPVVSRVAKGRRTVRKHQEYRTRWVPRGTLKAGLIKTEKAA